MRQKVLVAEDDTFLANAYRVKLEKEGFQVFIAPDGKEAMMIFQNEQPDIVILDLIMPEMDGFSVLKEIRASQSKIPVVVASNLGQKEDIEKSKELGATDYIVKSDISIQDLVSKIKSFL